MSFQASHWPPLTRSIGGAAALGLFFAFVGFGEAAQAAPATALALHVSTHDLPPGVTSDRVRDALARAAAVWSYPAIACSNVELRVEADSRERLATQDGVSLVLFRDREWCHNDRCGGLRTFPLHVAAMTSAYASGEKLEGDIELNAVTFDWTSSRQDVERPRAPLQAVLAHELGHVLGLPDACGAAHSGKPLPCNAPPSIMLAPARLERPTEWDVKALCALHPRDAAPLPATATGARTPWRWVGALVLALAAALGLRFARSKRA